MDNIMTEQKTIDHLNTILSNELVAINQYMLHSKMLEHWGYKKLACEVRDQSIGEMKHAEEITDRILKLDGLPNYQDYQQLSCGKDVTQILKNDLQLEKLAIPTLKQTIVHLELVQDFISRSIVTKILEEEENHLEWLSTQITLIEQVGLNNYLQSQI